MDTAIASALFEFAKRHPVFQKLHEDATRSLPGGNTRSLLYTPPFPISMRKGEGHLLFDEDGNEYCDFVGELTAGLYGHSHPILQQALITTICEFGLNLGATNIYEQKYASLLCDRFGLDRIRFTNSGTEANLHCISAARRFTLRRKIVAFRGGYHGSVLAFPTGAASNNVDIDDFLVLQYNDTAGLKEAFKLHRDIAAVIVEGMQGSGGSISASTDFLTVIRDLTKEAGSVFILDEVMTSRLGLRGLAGVLDLAPDLVTFGKYLGGGMPFGAFGGKGNIMSVYDPRLEGSLAHSGTFQNNTLMLNAGFTGLSEVFTPEVIDTFNKRGDELRQRLARVFKGTKFCITGRGSLMCIHATTSGLEPAQITCKDDVIEVQNGDLKQLFWLEMISSGFWVQLRGSIALNLQMPQGALDSFVAAVEEFCDKHRSLIMVS